MQYDKDGKGGLTLSEMVHMGTRVRKIMDPVRPAAACCLLH